MSQAIKGKCYVRFPKCRINGACIQLYGVIFIGARTRAETAHVADIKFSGLPGLQAFLNLFRETIRIAWRFVGLLREDGGSLMVPVPIPAGSGKSRHDYIWAKGADHTHNVCECYVMASPFLKSLVGTF